MFGGDDGFRDDLAELFALIKNSVHLPLREQLGANDETDPGSTFAEFFQADPKFVDKISSAFRSTALVVIGCTRCRTTN